MQCCRVLQAWSILQYFCSLSVIVPKAMELVPAHPLESMQLLSVRQRSGNWDLHAVCSVHCFAAAWKLAISFGSLSAIADTLNIYGIRRFDHSC